MTPARQRLATPAMGVRVGSLLGFDIRIDVSWFVIFFLVVWSLAEGVFPQRYAELGRLTHLAMGLAGSLLFFASLLVHELSHALVSRRKGIPVEGITLFIFGGMALTRREPDSAKDELLIAGVGPLTSFLLAGLFAVLARLGPALDLGTAVIGVADYLAFINMALAVFNLMPGFPMDGGRVFRAIAWSATGDRAKATRWAVRGGQAFGTVLMVLGGVQALTGAPLAGLWLVFIGWFLRSLAGNSLRQQGMQSLLAHSVTSDLMCPHPEVVAAHLSINSLVQDHFMQLRYGSYPVLDGDALVGMVTPDGVKRVPRGEWEVRTAADAMTPLAACAVVAPDTPLESALQEMGRVSAEGRALVLEEGRLVGIISATDVARWLHRMKEMQKLVAPAG